MINILKTSDEDPNKAEAINQFMEYFLNPENGGGYYYDEIGVPTANAFAEPKLDEASEILQQYLEKRKQYLLITHMNQLDLMLNPGK